MPAETYTTIEHRLGLGKSLPYTPQWSAAADFLAIIMQYCLQQKPDTIVECSSGLTTVVLCRCCQINGCGQVISLENGEKFVMKTRQQLDEFGLGAYASVVHSPLEKIALGDTQYDWYDTEAVPECSIDMLVIDGPPGFLQNNSRYPALPVLHGMFSENCAVFLDDAARDDEKEIVKMWRDEFKPKNYEYAETERGCSILSF